ncbi:MAG: excinuclease ABC subunit C [Paludibacteraceae bacterium]|nr:excinuclease ABC subunit C [Paludibacteraceae bacterium]
MAISQHIKQILDSLPERPGVYQHLNKDGDIIYVGKAKNLKRRVSSYFQKDIDSLKTRQLVSNIADIHYIVVASEQDAFLLENNLIKKYQPYYNILLKDGKSYPSVCVTKEEYPRVFKTRHIDKSKGEYYGPFTYGNMVDMVLELIHDLYPLRTCSLQLTEKGVECGKYKVCLKYHIKKCCGVCENYVNRETYLRYIDEVRKIIRGDARDIARDMLSQMNDLSREMRFEEAQEIKRKYDLIEKFNSKTIITNTTVKDTDVFGYLEDNGVVYVSVLRIHKGSIVQGHIVEYKKMLDEDKSEILAHAIVDLRERMSSLVSDVIVPFLPDFIDENVKVSIPTQGDRKRLLDLAMDNVRQHALDRKKQADKLNPNQRAVRILTNLQNKLGLSKLPVVIDSFDNSNIQGTNAVAACVVFRMAKPSKSEYKRFNIKTVEGADDYASMREVVYRKYKQTLDESGELPDLILADGGIGQMHAIKDSLDALEIDIPVAGLVKDSHHRTASLLYGFPPQEVQLRPTEELFLFLTQVQDEVHRFAITFHRNKRSKSQIHSELDDIQGVGGVTKKKLLQKYRSVSRLKQASEEDIVNLLGRSKASIVYNYFHPEISA